MCTTDVARSDREKNQVTARNTEPGLTSEKAAESKNETEKVLDEENIGKAIRFWTHPTLRDVSPQEKLAYLHEQGVSRNQIHKAWEKIAEDSTNSNNPSTASAYRPSNQLPAPILWNNNVTPQTPPQHDRQDNRSYGDKYQQNQGYQATMPQQYGGMHQQFEDDGPISASQGISLVVLGSALGLTAAAAVRWLNGGDFKLLPPPTHSESAGCHASNSRRIFLEENRTLETEGSDKFENDHEEEVAFQDGDESEVDEEHIHDSLDYTLLEKIDALSESLISNSGLQEKLIQKLHSQTSITDHSMDLLRSTKNSNSTDTVDKSDETDFRAIWFKLAEIKAELSAMKRIYSEDSKLDDPTLARHLSHTLTELDVCLRAAKMRNGESLHIPQKEDFMTVAAKETSVNTIPQNCLESEKHATTARTVAANLEAANPEPSTDREPEHISSCVEQLSFQESIRRIAEEPDATARRAGCQILYLYVVNLSGRPDNPRYRKIYTSNESFRKVENLNGARDLLHALGFVAHPGGYLEWLSSNNVGETENIDKTAEVESIMQRLNKAAAALRILKSPEHSEKLVESALAAISQKPLEMVSSSLRSEEAVAEDTLGVVPIVSHHNAALNDPAEVQDDESKRSE